MKIHSFFVSFFLKFIIVFHIFSQIINTIRKSDLRHRRFKLLTEELDSKFADIMYFNSIRWLSCGHVMNRFCDLMREIQLFLEEEKLDADFRQIWTPEWKQRLYFLADITKHLNELNVILQGKKKFIWDLSKAVQEFKLKLEAFKNQIKDNDFTFFPTLDTNQFKEEFELGYDTDIFVRYIDILINAFKSRFSDFEKFHLAFKFLKNPFGFDKNNIQNLSDLFGSKKTHLEFDISLINEENDLPNETSDALWRRLMSECNFFLLKDIVPKFLCMFGSTYVCEASFSSLARRKNKYRNALSQVNLESELRCELSESTPDLNQLTESKECHPSH